MATIRPLMMDDLDAVMRLEPILFPYSPWTREGYEEELSNHAYNHYYAIESDQQFVGYGGVFRLYENAEILTLGIDPEFQKQGYGRMLLQYLLESVSMCDQISLEVKADNKSAIALYESLGFKQVAIRKNYYQDGSDAILMVEVKV